MSDSLNLSIGVIPLLATALEMIVILFFLKILAIKTADTDFGAALAFIL